MEKLLSGSPTEKAAEARRAAAMAMEKKAMELLAKGEHWGRGVGGEI